MAKGLNKIQVGLTFTADTGNAKAQLRELKNTLDSLYSPSKQSGIGKGLTKEVNEALTSVAKLKSSLEAATNVDTGRLDLSKFTRQLQKNEISLKQYARQLTELGPSGEKAFMQLAQAIVTAEVPMRRANAQLTEMWTTMKNTARWQISSSMLHGFMGSVQKAYGYAQDLNESLNDIRIVTGYNTDQMAKFAVEANKAAKALSATTTEYTNASLIYFQQGLSDQQVKDRTDITVKMANVSKQSAETVSDQMTAVWNNFYDGSKSLEYYADVMTKLGAATASSSDEIAQGLEKFAAIADTVGLSYDYAASALATVTAETRQSADVVGTAFKTIFARIEGLSLGETLDDGTDLNKYSAALATIGVNIKDTNGEMKQMDQILEEMGSRWQTLGQDQKIALAQTVAGVRQYNQLIALMDNWGTFQENLAMAQNSQGALQEQADIYAESWEAARDRVTAAAETIYQNLLNDKFFIELNNGLAGILGVVGDLTKSLGGMSGTLGLIGAVAVHVFRDQISNSIAQGIENFRVFTGAAKHATDALREQAIEAVQYFSRGVEADSASGLESRVMIDQINRSYEIQKISQGITEEKARQLKEMVKIEEQYGKEAIAAQRAKETAITDYTTLLSNTKGKMIDGGASYDESNEGARLIKSSLSSTQEIKDAIESKDIEDIEKATLKWAERQKKATDELGKLIKKAELSTKELQDLAKAHINQAKTTKQAEAALSDYEKRLQQLDKELKNGGYAVDALSKGLTSGLSSITSFATGLSALSSAWKSLEDPDLSTFDKFTTILTSLSFGLPSMAKGFKDFGDGIKFVKEGFSGSLPSMMAYILGLDAETLAQQKSNKEKIKGVAVDKAQVAAEYEARLSTIAAAGAKGLKATAEEAENKAKTKGIGLTLTDIAVSKIEQMSEMGGTAAKIAHTAAQWALNTSMSPFVALMLASVAAMLPYIAAAGVLTGAVYLIVKAVNAENEALKEAKEAEEQAAETSQRLAEKINTINDALKEIDGGADTLKNLEERTLDWYQALTKVNDQVQKIMEMYPELVEMGFITMDENGMLGITDQGMDYISQDLIKKQQATNNAALRQKQDTLEVETNNKWNDFQAVSAIGDSYSLISEEGAKSLIGSYKTYGDLMFSDIEFAKAAFNNMNDASLEDAEHIRATNESILKFINHNKELIIEQSQNLDEINQVDRQIIESKLATYGSIRKGEDAAALMGDFKGYSIEGEGNAKALKYTKDGSDEEFNMQYSKNYDKDNLPQEIKDFMSLQGSDDVEYVAQRNGKLVLEIDGEEESFSQEQVYNLLGEYYSDEAFGKQLTENLKNSLDGIEADFSGLNTEELINIDNLKIGLNNIFEETEEGSKKAEQSFQAVVQAYGTSKEQMEALAADTEYVDFTGPEFEQQVKLLGEGGPEAVNKFKAALQELNAIGKIESMDAWFGEQAKNLGLGEDEAKEMKVYAKHLLEVADEAEGVSDSLIKDADSAADLAVEVTRMNKGVQTLADNFEEWGDILEKSSKSSMEYALAMDETKSALADVLDVEKEFISNDFVEAHLEDIEKAAIGDAEAIDKLRASMDEEIIANISLGQTEEFYNKLNELDLALKDTIPEDIEVGAILNTGEFLEAAQKLVEESGMTANEANAYFAGIGYEPVYNQEEIPDATSMSAPNARTVTQISSIGWAEENMTIGGTEVPIRMPQITTETISTPLESTETEGPMRLTSFSGEQTPPKIRGLRKKATGSMNNYSAANAGGKPARSGSSKKPKNVKSTKKSEVVERYKEITDALDDVGDSMERVSKLSDRLYGQAKINAMNKQLKLIEKENKLLKEKQKQAKAYLKSDKAELNRSAKKAGVSFEYDKEGNITNYTSQMEKLYAELSAAEKKANSFKDADAQEKYIESTLTPIQDKIEALKTAMEAYEETRELLEDLDLEIQDNIYEAMDIKLETMEYTVEVNLDIKDQEIKLLETLLSGLEDQAYSQAEAIGYLAQSYDIEKAKADDHTAGINQIMKEKLTEDDFSKWVAGEEIDWTGYQGQFTEAEIEALKGHYDGLQEAAQNLANIDKQIREKYIEAFEEWNETLDRSAAKIEHIGSLIDNLKNIADLTKAFNGFDSGLTKLFASAGAAVAQAQVEAAKAANEAANKALENAKTDYANGLITENELRVFEDRVQETESNLLSSTSTAIQAFLDEMTTAVESTLRDYEKQMSGTFGSFEAMSEGLERYQETSSRYVADYEKIYKLSKLNRDLQQDMDKSLSNKSRQQYAELMEEIAQYAQEGVEMSAYDVEFLEKKIELRKAEIALQEAQNAKTAVIRRRDDMGDWGYVYTADQEKAADALQNYEDKLYEITKFNEETMNQISSDIVGIYQQFSDAMNNIHQRWLEGYYQTEEEYNAALQETESYYNGLMSYRLSELDKTVVNSNLLYKEDWSNYEFYVGVKDKDNKTYSDNFTFLNHQMKVSQEDFFLTFGATTLGQITGYQSSQAALLAYTNSTAEVLPKFARAFASTKDKINGTLGLIGDGITLDNLAQKFTNFLGTSGDENSKGTGLLGEVSGAVDKINEDCKSMQTALKGVRDELDKWNKIDLKQFLETVAAGNKAFLDFQKAMAPKVKDPAKEQTNNNNNNNNSNNNNNNNSNSKQDSKKEKDKKLASRAAKIVEGVHNGTIKQTKKGWKPSAEAAGYTKEEIDLALDVINESKSGGGYDYNYEQAMNLLGYDTGGYTGEWGPEGRLAMLHQKEIVLNARDTENMLAMTQMVRDIAKQIDLTAVPTSQSIAPAAITDAYRDIQQNVTIHAEFPDATSAREIEEAFNSLSLQASQYLNRK